MPRHLHLTKVRHTVRRVGLFIGFLNQKKNVRGILMAMVAVVGFAYLVTVVGISTRGYEMRDLEKSIDALKQENKKLNLQVAEKQSLSRIEEWVKTAGMVAATRVQYISGATGAVAIK